MLEAPALQKVSKFKHLHGKSTKITHVMKILRLHNVTDLEKRLLQRKIHKQRNDFMRLFVK
jgi:hypothetical protein